MTARQKRKKTSVPPLRNLRAVMDAHGLTRPRLTARTGLTPPTIRRALGGTEGVSRATAEKIARAVGAPVESLYSDLTQEELASAARLPAVTAGRGYSYPETAARPAGRRGTPAAKGPAPGQGATGGKEKRPGDREYVVLHREQFEELKAELATTNRRLGSIEEALEEVASRPIAEFDVRLVEKGPRRPGEEKREQR